MRTINLDYIVEGTGGKLYARAENNAYDGIDYVEIDNRRMQGNCLFFCIVGAKVDAHTFLPNVRERGCHNIVVSDEKWAEKMAEFGDMNIVLVDETVEALNNLTSRYMDDWKGLKKVAVTGSAGKTTTKEFLYSVLSTKFKTGKTLGNHNSETGIPLTVFNSYGNDIEMAVAEIGIGYGRDMHYLVEMIKPDNAIITNVGSVHMECFGSSREKLLEAKLRVTELFDESNTLVVNNQRENLSVESIKAHSSGKFNIITVGDAEDCDYRISDIEDKGIDGVKGKIHHAGKTYDIQVPVVGAHNLYNAAEAIAIGMLYDISIDDALNAVKKIDVVADRSDVIRGKYTILNDTYNANPEAMKAAVSVIKNTDAKRRGVIVGDMYELGDDEVALHEDVGRYIAECGLDFVVTLGGLCRHLGEAVEASDKDIKVYKFDDIETLVSELDNILMEGDLFLVKASNSVGLSRIVKELVDTK